MPPILLSVISWNTRSQIILRSRFGTSIINARTVVSTEFVAMSSMATCRRSTLSPLDMSLLSSNRLFGISPPPSSTIVIPNPLSSSMGRFASCPESRCCCLCHPFVPPSEVNADTAPAEGHLTSFGAPAAAIYQASVKLPIAPRTLGDLSNACCSSGCAHSVQNRCTRCRSRPESDFMNTSPPILCCICNTCARSSRMSAQLSIATACLIMYCTSSPVYTAVQCSSLCPSQDVGQTYHAQCCLLRIRRASHAVISSFTMSSLPCSHHACTSRCVAADTRGSSPAFLGLRSDRITSASLLGLQRSSSLISASWYIRFCSATCPAHSVVIGALFGLWYPA